jgi:hypothetical protein
MNIELDEVVVHVSDESLEQAAGGLPTELVLAPADR